MDLKSTISENNDICENLYKSNLISFDKFLDCTGQTEAHRVANISDNHKYAVSNTDITTAENIFDKRVYIYNKIAAENDELYIAIVNNKPTLTTGVFNPLENTFIIEKTSPTTIALKHLSTGKYISYDIPKLELSLTNRKSIKTDIATQTFIIDGMIRFKFNLLGAGGVQSDYSLIINNDGMLAIEKASNETWFIDIIKDFNTTELDELLKKINDAIDEYNKTLVNYYINKQKTEILTNTKSYLSNTVNDIFDEYRTLQRNNKINITPSDITNFLRFTQHNLEENQISTIDEKLGGLKANMDTIKKDLDLHKTDIELLLSDIDIAIDENKERATEINKAVEKYNAALLHNNIMIDLDKYISSDEKQQLEILKSEINSDVKNKTHKKKTKINAVYISIIVLLSLIIIIQLAWKVLKISPTAAQIN